MKNKAIIILCLLLLLLSFSACSQIKTSNSSNVVSDEQSTTIVSDESQGINKDDKQNGAKDSDVNNKETENLQNSAYGVDSSENNDSAEAPPTPSTEENNGETIPDEIVSTDSDGWINKWY